MTTRILLADEYQIVRQGLRALLEDEADLEVVGEASDGCTAVEMAKQRIPDAVLMDIRMPHMNGIEASRAIHSEFPGIRVIGLSILEKSDIDGDMLEAGAVTCFSKNDPWDVIMAGIHKVLVSESPASLVM